MDHLYLTQDVIGTPTGGGTVTYHEYRALERLGGRCFPIDRQQIRHGATPFDTDHAFAELLKGAGEIRSPGIAHIYAGCFSETVEILKSRGFKVTYTAAAHDIKESQREWVELGLSFDFPHLVVPELWERYVRGYRLADLVICPSELSAKLMRSYGCERVVVIPHGCDLTSRAVPAPMPAQFTVGYLGQGGPDKGIRYLLAAWKEAALPGQKLLIAGGNESMVSALWRKYGGGEVEVMGFVKDVSDFYDRISVYCQPSVSEGFGIEVLEALAHGRPVIASTGAGAAEVLAPGCGTTFAPRDVEALVRAIKSYAPGLTDNRLVREGARARGVAYQYGWRSIQDKYVEAWEDLVAG